MHGRELTTGTGIEHEKRQLELSRNFNCATFLGIGSVESRINVGISTDGHSPHTTQCFVTRAASTGVWHETWI